MRNHPKRKAPVGWPKNLPLPSEEEAEKIVREGEEMLRRGPEEIKRNPQKIEESCKVCGGEIIEEFIPIHIDNPVIGGRYPTERILYCKDCGVAYHHLPKNKMSKKVELIQEFLTGEGLNFEKGMNRKEREELDVERQALVLRLGLNRMSVKKLKQFLGKTKK